MKKQRLELDVIVDGLKIPAINNPNFVGVTFSNTQYFTPLVTLIAIKARSRNEILKVLADSNWGRGKETLLGTYKI